MSRLHEVFPVFRLSRQWRLLGLLVGVTSSLHAQNESSATPAIPPSAYRDDSASEQLIKESIDAATGNDFGKALRLLDDALKFCPNNARGHLDEALRLYAGQDFAGAKEAAVRAAKAYPKLGMIYHLSGTFRAMTLDPYGAILDMSLSLFIAPNNRMSYVIRGESFFQVGNHLAAIEDFTMAMNFSNPQLRPGDLAAPYFDRGRCYRMMGNDQAALRDFDRAIEFVPDGAQGRAYMERAWVYRNLERLPEAIADATTAIRFQPQNVDYLTQRAALLAEHGDIESALRDGAELLNVHDEKARVHFCHGVLLETCGRNDEALAAYSQAIALAEAKDDHDISIYANFFRDLLTRRMGRSGNREYLADVFSWDDDWAKRVALFLSGHLNATALERDARNKELAANVLQIPLLETEAFYFIGMTHLLDGDIPAARKYLQRCVDTRRTILLEYSLARYQLRRLSAPNGQ